MKNVNINRSGDRDIQLTLGALLRVGIISSMSVVFVGALIYLFFHYRDLVNYAKFDPAQAPKGSIGEILSGLTTGNGESVIQMGILLLIFTPVLRILFSIFGFMIERDYLYVLIGVFVLTVILFGLSNKLMV